METVKNNLSYFDLALQKRADEQTTSLLKSSIAVEQNKKIRSGIGHQLTSEARHMRSAASHIEEAYSDLTKAGNTTEILDLRSELHRIINRLGELACAAEEQYNQNV